MKALTCLVICLVTTARSDHNSDMRILNLTDPTLTFEEISEIVNNPIYRERTPLRLISSAESTAEFQSSKLNGKLEPISKLPMPSAELEAPLETAQDVYGKHALLSSTPLPIYVPSVDEPQEKSELSPMENSEYMPYNEPLSSEMTFMGTALPPVVPSRDLELPYTDIQKHRTNYPPVPSRELQTPLFEPYYEQYNDEEYVNPSVQAQKPLPYRGNENILIPIISDTLEPPKFLSSKNRHNPTKTFPKKYNSRLNEIKKKKILKEKPVVELINEESNEDVKYFKRQNPIKLVEDPSIASARDESFESYLHKQALEKQRQMYEEAQLKKREKMFNEAKKQQQFLDDTVSQAFGTNQEPETSETELNTFHDGETSFAAPTNHPSLGGVADAHHGVGGERTEFRMHGQHGPHSYKFGYDTGEGKNRQFRFEERDNDGYVKGHYGYYDRTGKLQVVNYDAHPQHGFHAEGPFGKV